MKVLAWALWLAAVVALGTVAELRWGPHRLGDLGVAPGKFPEAQHVNGTWAYAVSFLPETVRALPNQLADRIAGSLESGQRYVAAHPDDVMVRTAMSTYYRHGGERLMALHHARTAVEIASRLLAQERSPQNSSHFAQAFGALFYVTDLTDDARVRLMVQYKIVQDGFDQFLQNALVQAGYVAEAESFGAERGQKKLEDDEAYQASLYPRRKACRLRDRPGLARAASIKQDRYMLDDGLFEVSGQLGIFNWKWAQVLADTYPLTHRDWAHVRLLPAALSGAAESFQKLWARREEFYLLQLSKPGVAVEGQDIYKQGLARLLAALHTLVNGHPEAASALVTINRTIGDFEIDSQSWGLLVDLIRYHDVSRGSALAAARLRENLRVRLTEGLELHRPGPGNTIVLDQEIPLVNMLRPYLPGAAPIPTWITGALFEIVPHPIARAALAQARALDPLPAAAPYFDALEAELAWRSGSAASALEHAQRALSALAKIPEEAVLAARTALVAAEAAHRLGRHAEARELYDRVLQGTTGVYSLLRVRMPVRLQAADDPASQALLKELTASQLLRIDPNAYQLEIQPSGFALSSSTGKLYQRVSLPAEYATSGGSLRGILDHLFARPGAAMAPSQIAALLISDTEIAARARALSLRTAANK